MSMALVVANQTLPSAALAEAIRDRIQAGTDAIHVVVPATPPVGHGFTWDEEQGRQEAELRLATFLDQLRSSGVTASGEVGDRDPISAVRDALRGREVDEILLSTLPPGISRWLGQDVPSRLRGAVDVPVTVVYEEAKAASPGG
jgi:hypothetical protein